MTVLSILLAYYHALQPRSITMSLLEELITVALLFWDPSVLVNRPLLYLHCRYLTCCDEVRIVENQCYIPDYSDKRWKACLDIIHEYWTPVTTAPRFSEKRLIEPGYTQHSVETPNDGIRVRRIARCRPRAYGIAGSQLILIQGFRGERGSASISA